MTSRINITQHSSVGTLWFAGCFAWLDARQDPDR
jgi:hypothetical protein